MRREVKIFGKKAAAWLLMVAMLLPFCVLGLPLAIGAVATVSPGDTFELDGVKYSVTSVYSGGTGANTVSVIGYADGYVSASLTIPEYVLWWKDNAAQEDVEADGYSNMWTVTQVSAGAFPSAYTGALTIRVSYDGITIAANSLHDAAGNRTVSIIAGEAGNGTVFEGWTAASGFTFGTSTASETTVTVSASSPAALKATYAAPAVGAVLVSGGIQYRIDQVAAAGADLSAATVGAGSVTAIGMSGTDPVANLVIPGEISFSDDTSMMIYHVTAVADNAFTAAIDGALSIGSGVGTIGDSAFSGCTSSATVSLQVGNGDSITVGTSAFGNAAVTVRALADEGGLLFSGWTGTASYGDASKNPTALTGGGTVEASYDVAQVGSSFSSGMFIYEIKTMPSDGAPGTVALTGLANVETVQKLAIINSVSYGSDSFSVVEIGANAFVGYLGTEVTVPNLVTTIGANAFSGISGLNAELRINSGGLALGAGAFDSGTAVKIIAGGKSGYLFAEWAADVRIGDVTAATTTFTSDGASATIEATYTVDTSGASNLLSEDAKEDIEVMVNTTGGSVGNLSYAGQNLFDIFANNAALAQGKVPTSGKVADGFYVASNSGIYFSTRTYDAITNGSYSGDTEEEMKNNNHGTYGRLEGDNRDAKFSIVVDDNPTLAALAKSGQAEIFIAGCAGGNNGTNAPWNGGRYSAEGEIYVKINGVEIATAAHNGWGDPAEFTTGWITLSPGDVIEFEFYAGNNKGTASNAQELDPGVRDFLILVRDETRPVLSNYDFSSNGAEYKNTTKNTTELHIMEYQIDNETLTSEVGQIDLDFNFSEPVRTEYYSIDANMTWSGAYAGYEGDNISETGLLKQIVQHNLFKNDSTTGYEKAGLAESLKLVGIDDPAPADLDWENVTASDQSGWIRGYFKTLNYQYKAYTWAYSSNQPMQNGADWDAGIVFNNTLPLIDKLNRGDFYDAAGNYLFIDPAAVTASDDGNSSVNGETANPFAFFDVIVDAVAPTYSTASNGIQPDILTKVVLSKNDTITFKVNLSESATLRRYLDDNQTKTNWEASGTYLLFNNGMKAYYVSGSGTNQWLFEMTIAGLDSEATDLLEVAALAHDNHPADTYVLTDYVGNPLVQVAGVGRSSIAWAELQVDNLAPEIEIEIMTTDGKADRVKIVASDPDTALGEGGSVTVPGSGIYYVAGGQGSGGLVYYAWVQGSGVLKDGTAFGDGIDENVEAALTALTGDNYAALKKYSLTATSHDDYAIYVANNSDQIEIPDTVKNASGTWYVLAFTSDLTWDSARQLIQYNKLKTTKLTTAGMTAYLEWINTYEKDVEGKADDALSLSEEEASNAAIYYADTEGMKASGDYGLWANDLFTADDSNWTYGASSIVVDHTAPTVAFGAVSGNNTASASVSFTVQDEGSGIASLDYTFVEAGGTPTSWTSYTVTAGSTDLITVSASAPSAVSGDYDLWVKAVDVSENEALVKMDDPVTVNTDKAIYFELSQETNADDAAVQSILGLYASVAGVQGGTSLGIDKVEYAVGEQGGQQPGDSDYQAISSSGAGDQIESIDTEKYEIPDLTGYDGTYVVYIKITDEDNGVYDYSVTFKLDNTAPTVLFSPNTIADPRESVSTIVSVSDVNNGAAEKYMWQADGAPAPALTDGGWVSLGDDLEVTLSGTQVLQPGETGLFVLWVYATDEAGNAALKESGTFYLMTQEDVPVPTVQGTLKIVVENDDGTRTGVASLSMPPEITDPSGYYYSIAVKSEGSDTVTWARWMPYESMVSVELGTEDLSRQQIMLKFRSPSGNITADEDILVIDDLSVSTGEPVWATVNRNMMRKLPAGAELEIQLTRPDYVTVESVTAVVGSSAEIALNGDGITYTITDNGYYAFKLKGTGTLEDTLYVVVDSFDSIAPIGTIAFSTMATTGQNVTAFLSANEAVKVTAIDLLPALSASMPGAFNHTFTDNYSARFTFEDEAGNEASVVAAVDWIDKTQPSAVIADLYSYNGQSYGYIATGGTVTLAQGVFLQAQKEQASGKSFSVISGADSPGGNTATVTENGTYQFVIADAYGNTSIAEKEITHIISSIAEPAASVSTGRADAASPMTATVTISGKLEGHDKGNKLYYGPSKWNMLLIGLPINEIPVESDGTYSFVLPITFSDNGSSVQYLSDELGNSVRYTVEISGIDNVKPTLTFEKNKILYVNKGDTVTAQTILDLGGYAATDDISDTVDVTVIFDGNASALDTSEVGSEYVTYQATDENGNVREVSRKIYIMPTEGLLVTGNNGTLFYSGSTEAAILNTNAVQLTLTRHNLLEYFGGSATGTAVINEKATFDIYIQQGLYREGQIKYISTVSLQDQTGTLDGSGETATIEIPAEALTATGWYTIIIRNQEREREFTTFFIASFGD